LSRIISHLVDRRLAALFFGSVFGRSSGEAFGLKCLLIGPFQLPARIGHQFAVVIGAVENRRDAEEDRQRAADLQIKRSSWAHGTSLKKMW
jgi:hypothetical protein